MRLALAFAGNRVKEWLERNMTMRSIATILAGSLLLAGCMANGGAEGAGDAAKRTGSSELAQPSGAAIEAVFQCGNGKRFDIAFSGTSARLTVGGTSHVLAQQPSGSGYSYAGEGHSLRGTGKDVTWTEPSGVSNECFEIDPAHPPQIQPPGPPVTRGLPGTKWRLVQFQSMDDSIGTKVPPNPEKYLLTFASDGTLTAQLDCNRLAGKWEATPSSPTGGGLAIGGGAMTRAMCQPGAMDTQIARDMGFVRSYTIGGTQLHLALQADAGIYTWQAVPPQ